MKKKLMLVLAMLMLVTPLAAAQSVYPGVYKTNLTISEATLLSTPPKVGEKLKVTVTISVAYESPVPLSGYALKVWFKKPDGTTTTPEWFTYTDSIGRGLSKTVYVSTNTMADQEGTWWVYVELYTQDKATKLSSDSATFSVLPSTPITTIDINQVAGYGIAAGAILAALYFAMRRR